MSKQNEQQIDRDGDSPWEACEPGTLRGYGLGVRAAERRSFVLKASGTCAAVACLLAAGIFALQLDWTRSDRMAKETRPGGAANLEQANASPVQLVSLACDDVMRLAADFFDQELNSEQVRLTKEHLRGCPKCRQKYQEEAERRGILLDIAAVTLPAFPSLSLRVLLAAAR